MDGVGLPDVLQPNSAALDELTSESPSSEDDDKSTTSNTFAAGIARAGSRVLRNVLKGFKSAARSGARYAARAQTTSTRSVAAGLDSLATLTDVAGAMGSKAPAARTLVSRRVDTHVRFSAAKSIMGEFLRNAAAGALLFTVYESLHSRIPAHCSHPVLASAGAGAIAGAVGGTVATALEAVSRASARASIWSVRSAAANIISNAPIAAAFGAAEWSAGFSAWEYARKIYVDENALVAATVAGGGDTAPGTAALFGVAAASMLAGAAQASGQAMAQAVQVLLQAQSTHTPFQLITNKIYTSFDFKSLFRAMPAAAIGYAALEMSRYT
jgi:hypothetical protein